MRMILSIFGTHPLFLHPTSPERPPTPPFPLRLLLTSLQALTLNPFAEVATTSRATGAGAGLLAGDGDPHRCDAHRGRVGPS